MSTIDIIGRSTLRTRLQGLFQNHSDRLAGGIEQGLGAVISMGALIVLSRVMPIDAFGVFSFAVGVWLIVEMLQYSVIISPFIVDCPKPEDAPEEFGAWLLGNALLALIVASVLGLTGIIAWIWIAWLGQALVLSALIAIAGILYMFVRRANYHFRNKRATLGQVATYGLSYGLALATLIVLPGQPSFADAALAMTAAYLVPALVWGWPYLRRARFNQGLKPIGKARKLVIELGTAGTVWEAGYGGALLALGLFATPAAVAVYSITRTLLRPVTMVLSTLIDVDLSRMSRQHAAQGAMSLRSSIFSFWIAATLFCAAPMAALFFFPGQLLGLVYGQQYVHATLELQLRAALFLPLIVSAPLDIGLAVLRDARFLLKSHSFGLLAGALALVVFAAVWEISAASVLVALVVGRTVTVPIVLTRFLKLTAAPVAKSRQETVS